MKSLEDFFFINNERISHQNILLKLPLTLYSYIQVNIGRRNCFKILKFLWKIFHEVVQEAYIQFDDNRSTSTKSGAEKVFLENQQQEWEAPNWVEKDNKVFERFLFMTPSLLNETSNKFFMILSHSVGFDLFRRSSHTNQLSRSNRKHIKCSYFCMCIEIDVTPILFMLQRSFSHCSSRAFSVWEKFFNEHWTFIAHDYIRLSSSPMHFHPSKAKLVNVGKHEKLLRHILTSRASESFRRDTSKFWHLYCFSILRSY